MGRFFLSCKSLDPRREITKRIEIKFLSKTLFTFSTNYKSEKPTINTVKRYEGKEFKKPVYMNSMGTNNNHGIAAIIMDAQPKLLASLAETERQLLTGSLEFLVKSMQVLNIPVLLTEQVPEKLGKTIPEISDLMSDFSAFEKTTFSAFGANEFSTWLEQNDIQQVLIGGIETSICIYQTAVEANALNIGVTILEDCIASRRKGDAHTALNELRNAGIHILGIESVIYSLLSSSEHPKFREISALVRDR